MTFALFKQTGLGTLRMRVTVEGLPVEFVSSEALERLPSGTTRERLCCLSSDPMDWPRFEQLGQPVDIIPEGRAAVFDLVDHEERITALFSQAPTVRTWLAADLTAAAGTITVASTAGFSANAPAYLNRETVWVSSVGTGVLTVARGLWDSEARAHYTGDGADLRRTPITDRPLLMVSRRVRVYFYGDGDDLTGDGTLFWSGVTAREPELDGAVWRLEAESPVRKLDAVIGGGLGEPIAPRGITYHRGNALTVTIRLHSTSSVGSGVDDSASVNVGGDGIEHFETQETFQATLNSRIATAISGFTGAPRVYVQTYGPLGALGWGFRVRSSSSTARYITVSASSPVDGDTIPTLYTDDDSDVRVVALSTTYAVNWRPTGRLRGARTVPRGTFGYNRLIGLEGVEGGSPTSGARDIYLAGDVDLTGVDQALVEWPDNGEAEAVTVGYSVESVDNSAGRLTLRWRPLPDGTVSNFRNYTAESQPKVTLTRELAFGHIGDLVQALITDATTETNRAGAPDISADDFHAATWTAVAARAARGRPAAAARVYQLGAEVELRDLMKNECRLVSLWIGFDSVARLIPVEHKAYAETDPAVTDIEVLDEERPRWRKQGLGAVKGALVKTGYVPHEDDWQGPLHTMLDVLANSLNPSAAMVEVEPRSTHLLDGHPTISIEDTRSLVRPMVSFLGQVYHVETVWCPVQAIGADKSSLDVQVGEGVAYTPRGRELPNTEKGTRAPKLRVGTVIERVGDFGHPGVRFTVMVPQDTVAGYAPAFGVTGQANVSGNQWDLTVVVGDPWGKHSWGEAGDTAALFLAAGDKMEVYQIAVASPTVSTCTVDSVTGNTVRVTFDAAWTPSTAHVLRFQDATTATASMQRYAFFANAEGRVGFALGAQSARRFAP